VADEWSAVCAVAPTERAICRCFSVVAEDRRLDLEADSEATRETWMDALLFLMKDRRAAQRAQ
jgi:hypothetical protein